MSTKIGDLTVEELKKIIAEAVRENTQDLIEDLLGFNSPSYLESIQEAREDYKKGRGKPLEELPDAEGFSYRTGDAGFG